MPLEPSTSKPAPVALASTEPAEGCGIYVAGLTWWTTDAELESLCSQFGAVKARTPRREGGEGPHQRSRPALEPRRPLSARAWNAEARCPGPEARPDDFVAACPAQRVRFFEDKANGKSKGYALVEFVTPDGAAAAKVRAQSRLPLARCSRRPSPAPPPLAGAARASTPLGARRTGSLGTRSTGSGWW